MGAKKFLVLCMVVLVLFASMFASHSTARDPFVGLAVGGSEEVSQTLYCCNNCRCQESWCVCDDRSPNGCVPGCRNCQCGHMRRSCYCTDILRYCPDLCGFSSHGSPSARATNVSASTPSLHSLDHV